MNDLRDAEREAKCRDFAQACVVAAISASMARALPSDENCREFVRIARVIDSEIDRPTEAPKTSEAPAAPPQSDDLVELLSEHGTLA